MVDNSRQLSGSKDKPFAPYYGARFRTPNTGRVHWRNPMRTSNFELLTNNVCDIAGAYVATCHRADFDVFECSHYNEPNDNPPTRWQHPVSHIKRRVYESRPCRKRVDYNANVWSKSIESLDTLSMHKCYFCVERDTKSRAFSSKLRTVSLESIGKMEVYNHLGPTGLSAMINNTSMACIDRGEKEC